MNYQQNQNAQYRAHMQNLQAGFDAPPPMVAMQPGLMAYVSPSPSPGPVLISMNSPSPTVYNVNRPPLHAMNLSEVPKPNEVWRRQSSTCRKVMQENIDNIDLADLAYDEKRNRYLQQRISKLKAEGNIVELRYMFHQLLPEAIQLAVDPYGNFVLQRLLKSIGSDLLDVLIQHLKPDLNRLAKDEYACRILQVILTHGSADGRETLLEIMLPEIEELLQDEYGSFVIQKVIETMDPCDLQELLEKIVPNIYRLARHKSSTRIIQELLRQLDPAQKAELTHELLSEVVDLSKHSVGQYSVIKMIQYGMPEVRKSVAESLQFNVQEIGHTQPGCKVLEKLLLKLRRDDLHILLTPLQKGNVMGDLAKCPYGNFVVQQALEAEPRGATMKCVEQIFANRSVHELNRFEKHVYKRMLNFKR